MFINYENFVVFNFDKLIVDFFFLDKRRVFIEVLCVWVDVLLYKEERVILVINWLCDME